MHDLHQSQLFLSYAVFLNKLIKTHVGFLISQLEATQFEVPVLIMFHWCHHMMFVAGHKLQDDEFRECVSQIRVDTNHPLLALIWFIQHNIHFKIKIIL